MLVSDFHYDLPEELIAQEPLPDRAASRLLHLSIPAGCYQDRLFRDFPNLLRPGDLVVFNNTRVFPARLFGRRKGLKLINVGRPFMSSSFRMKKNEWLQKQKSSNFMS